MRPRCKVLDKTFNTRAKDRTPLKKVCKERLLIPVDKSEKRYEFKDVWEEHMEIPEPDWDMPRETHGVLEVTVGTHTTTTTDGWITVTDTVEIDTNPTTDIHSPYRLYPLRNYYMNEDTTTGATCY